MSLLHVVFSGFSQVFFEERMEEFIFFLSLFLSSIFLSFNRYKAHKGLTRDMKLNNENILLFNTCIE